jgi:hypothetical protein
VAGHLILGNCLPICLKKLGCRLACQIYEAEVIAK